jgi:hypothetical protein
MGLGKRRVESISLPLGMGLDYSIELHGFNIAWRLFWNRLHPFRCYPSSLSEIDYYRVRALFANGDVRGYLTALMDAGALTYEECLRFAGRAADAGIVARPKPKRSSISKWVPGDHYYALGVKFDTYAEAKNYLASQGYECLGLIEQYTYRG